MHDSDDNAVKLHGEAVSRYLGKRLHGWSVLRIIKH